MRACSVIQRVLTFLFWKYSISIHMSDSLCLYVCSTVIMRIFKILQKNLIKQEVKKKNVLNWCVLLTVFFIPRTKNNFWFQEEIRPQSLAESLLHLVKRWIWQWSLPMMMIMLMMIMRLWWWWWNVPQGKYSQSNLFA